MELTLRAALSLFKAFIADPMPVAGCPSGPGAFKLAFNSWTASMADWMAEGWAPGSGIFNGMYAEKEIWGRGYKG